MKQATTTNTNTPRRAHPAAVRAALRSRKAKQLRKVSESVNYGTFSLATGTTYNALGQKASITYPDGAQYSYTYDTNNQLSTLNFPTGFGSITINSYLWTVPSQITLPGGTVRNQQYDGLLRLKTLAVKDPGQSQVLSYQYSYDLTSNIVAKATEHGNTSYGYDTLDRLTTAAYTGSTQTNEAYSYDQVANRLTDSKTAAATWTYDANNQLTVAGTLSYTYDANGNTTSQTDSANAPNTRNYVYDTDNRLIEVRNSSNTLIAAYSYDPFGRRLSKDAGTQKTYYLYNEEGLIAEADASGVLTKSYGYAPGSTFSTNPLWMKTGSSTGSLQAENNNVTQFIYGDVASGLNGLLSKIIYPTLSQYLQYDQRNRITQSTDTAAGSALALDAATSQTTRNQYDAAGNLTAVTDAATRTTGTRYDALGRVNQTTDPAGGTTQYGYDPRGNLTSVTDAKGNTHRFAYDRLDRMVKEIRPLQSAVGKVLAGETMFKEINRVTFVE